MIKNTLGYLLLGVLFITSDLRAGTGEPAPVGILRHYPTAEAIEVPCVTNIGITASKPFDESAVSALNWKVIGTRSGIHTGNIVLSDDRRTVIFKPLVPFDLSDTVSVWLSSSSEDGKQLQCSFSFVTCIRTLSPSLLLPRLPFSLANNLHHDSPPPDSLPNPPPDSLLHPPPDSLPHPPPPPPPPDSLRPPPPPDSLRPPPPSDSLPPPNDWGLITTVNSNPTPGVIFLSTSSFSGDLYITDENSKVLFSYSGIVSDFVRQPNGLMTFFGAQEIYYGIDTFGHLLKSYGCTNGVITDGHEFIVDSNGGYTLLGVSETSQNLSSDVTGGNDSAIIEAGVIQTYDSSGNLIFEWRGIDHYKVTDDTVARDLIGSVIDFEHANSIDIDPEGNYLLSNRNMSEVTKIDGDSGNILWRLGGSQNQFRFIGDTLGNSCQHYARWLKNGDIMMFDNGVYHNPPESRAVEYYLDTINMTATLKWQYRHNPPVFSQVMGDAERLDNGNTFIGWGFDSTVSATEVDSNGNVVYEMILPQNTYSYRAIKYPTFAPASASVLAAPPQASGLSFSVSPTAIGYDLIAATGSSTNALITLCDVTGRVVQNVYDGNISPDAQHIPLPTASLASGVYFCVLHSSEGEVMRPVLVTH